MAQQSPIFVKTEVFLLWLFRHSRTFPREERFRLSARMEEVAFRFHESLLYAAKTAKASEYLHKADAELDMLRTYFRFSLELRYTSAGQFQYAAECMKELGRLLGGWQKQM